MIQSQTEYVKAGQELRRLEEWLARLERDVPLREKGLTRAGIRKMIARLHEEIGEFEGTAESETAPH